MNLFHRTSKPKEHFLRHDWLITLAGRYSYIDNGNSTQMVNKEQSRVIYGSIFRLLDPEDNVKEVEDEFQYLEMKEGVEGDYNMAASIAQGNEYLTINVTYIDPDDEEWARSVIESAHREGYPLPSH